MLRRFTLYLATACVAAAALPGLASAQGVVAWVQQVDYADGTVAIAARSDVGAHSFDLYVDGVPAGTVLAPTPTEAVVFAPQPLGKPTVFRAVGRDDSGTVVGEQTIEVSPAWFVPSKPTIATPSGSVVPRVVWLEGVATGAVEVSAVNRDTRARYTAVASETAGGAFLLSNVRVPLGEGVYTVVARNGFGESSPVTYRLYRLVKGLPKKKRYVFVSKKILWMYDVKNNIVIHKWPVAIGTPQTPTPTGTFKIGKATKSGGAWGPMRRRLWRVRPAHRSVRTQYYIHGNNASWTIGTPASHGCIRMYNKHIRQFKKVVPTGTTVMIK